jgi:hypothetical protein
MKTIPLGVLVCLAFARDGSASEALDPRVVSIVSAVSELRLGDNVRTLAGFGTRHTLSSVDTPGRGIGAARQWIFDEMRRSSPRLQVAFDTYQVKKQGERVLRDVELRNVVAVLPGKSPRRVYVSGHYDSVARVPPAKGESGLGRFDWANGDLPAPGADDDASGTALTMELARVFGESGIDFDATLVFVAFAGEEQGLIGSTLHAQKAVTDALRIDAVLNNDIVGGAVGGTGVSDTAHVRVFSEGPEDSASRQLARHVRRQASRYVPGHGVVLLARHDRFGRGGDHTPFNQRGIAGVRMTESQEFYEHQHTVDDAPEGVSPAYLARNARVNAAAMAVLALAPPAPVVNDDRGRPQLGRGKTGYDAGLRWAASPGAAGYVVFWRHAWNPDWVHEQRVTGTELVLPGLSIDDVVLGVAAVDAAGNESLVSVYLTPTRSVQEVGTRPSDPGQP